MSLLISLNHTEFSFSLKKILIDLNILNGSLYIYIECELYLWANSTSLQADV